MEEKKLFLLDAYALIYRAYYALIRSPRVTSDGRNTSAIFGFCNTLDDILRKENPQYMAVCFDPPHGVTFRHEVYPEYKAQRDKQPEDITESIPVIKKIIEAYGIRVVEVPNYEADDVIGTLSVQAEKDGFTTYMMTPDKDYGQLVTDRVFMYRPALKGQGFEVRGPKEVCERYGISSPAQVIDMLALEGDVSDNVPGCPGVGEKTAAKLIGQFGSVEGLLDGTDQLKGAIKAKIEANAEQIRFSKFLVTIKTDVPLDMAPDALLRREPNLDQLRAIFKDLEFKTMLNRLNGSPKEPAKTAAPAPAADRHGMGSLFDLDEPTAEQPAVPVEEADIEWTQADTPEALAEFGRAVEASGASMLAISVLADGDEAMTAALRGVALSAGDSLTVYVPCNAERADALAVALQPLTDNPALRVASHDIKRDLLILRRHSVDITAPIYDTSLAHYLLKPEMKHDLADLAMNTLGMKIHDYTLSAAERRRPMTGSCSEVACRVCQRAVAVRRLVPELEKALVADGTRELMDEIELPLTRVLAEMEWTGVRVDTDELSAMSRRLTEQMNALERECWEMAGGQFNIGSPSQVGEVLFGRLKIDPKAKRTKTGAWSTTEEILEKHRREWPIVDRILQVRGLKKLLATYVDALPKLINPATGKIHTTYNQTVTATGRISSTNPNLQNIPIRTELGREIRRAFVADPGCLILSADYSQIELRLMACLSGDEAMVHAFNSGEDIHRATAAKIYHEDIADVTDDQRRNAKTANFGIIYGISAFGLSERLGIPRSEAKELIDGYLRTYPGVQRYMQEAIERARTQGWVSTVKGRKRYLPEINSRNAVVRGYAERNAINAPLQGSAADIIKIAMIRIAADMERRAMRSRMILQVHDELVFNVYPDELADLQQLVTEHMQDAYHSLVPLTVGAGTGQNWLEAH